MEEDDELVLRLIQRVLLARRNSFLAERYPDHASGFRKMEFRHRAVAAALMVKIAGREADASRPCRRCGRS